MALGVDNSFNSFWWQVLKGKLITTIKWFLMMTSIQDILSLVRKMIQVSIEVVDNVKSSWGTWSFTVAKVRKCGNSLGMRSSF